MSQLGTPINAALNFAPGGNPLLASGGGLAGLGLDYGASYASALKANQQNYNNIIGGYQTVLGNVGNTLGQGSTPWGVAGPAAQAIQDTYAQQSGGALQNSISRGVGGSTAAVAQQRGAALDASKAYAGLGAQLAQTYAGYQSNLGQGQLGFMNSVSSPYPNAGAYNQLYGMQASYAQAQRDRQLAMGLGAANRAPGAPQAGGASGIGSAGATNAAKFGGGGGVGGGGGINVPGTGFGGYTGPAGSFSQTYTSGANPYGLGQGGGFGLNPTASGGAYGGGGIPYYGGGGGYSGGYGGGQVDEFGNPVDYSGGGYDLGSYGGDSGY